MKPNTALFAIAILLFGTALTQPATSPSGGSETSEIAKEALEPVDIKKSIEDQMETTCRPYEKAGRTKLNMATQIVNARPTDKDWAKSRSFAYEAAVLKAQSEYISEQGQHIVGETAQHIQKAAYPNDEPPPFDDSALKSPQGLQQLVQKLVALGTGKIDQQLRDLGIDPKDYEKAPEPQRYVMFENAIRKTALKQAIGSIVGMVPVQTFEGNDGKGNFQIGVCLVTSQAMKDLAAQVLRAHGDIAPDPTKAQDLTLLYKDKSQLYRDFGVRRVFDEEGYPALISFYQWGSSYAGSDPVMKDQFQEEALRQATDLADTQLAEFLKGSMDARSQSQASEALEKAAERFPDGYIQDDEKTRRAVDGAIRDIKKSVSIDIVGLRTLYKWHGNHPITGQEVVGVIRIWSAKGEKTTREFRDNRTSGATVPNPLQGSEKAGITSGRSIMKPDDF